jgi:hypothetical protein
MKQQLYLFLAFLTCVISEAIINIDEGDEVLDISDYLKKSPLKFYYYPTANKTKDFILANGTFAMNSPVTVELTTELDGILINDMTMKYGGNALAPGDDYTVRSKLSTRVYPKDYFNAAKFSTNNSPFLHSNETTLAQCTYTNPGPTYTVGIFNNVTIDGYVSFSNYNFGIDKKSPGIKVITLSNFTVTIDTLDNLVKRKGSLTTLSDDVTFTQVHISNPNFDDNSYLIGETSDGQMYIWEILDSSEIGDIEKIKFYTKVSMSVFNVTDCIQIDIYKDRIILGANDGFVVANQTNDKWVIEYKDKTPVVDFITNNKTVYLIEKSRGMRIFDLNTLKFTKFEFLHPYLTHFDWAFDSYTQLYFIGVSVNNLPPAVNEIFIEMIVNTHDEREFNPVINKVIVSSHEYNDENIITDHYSGMTYLYDPETMAIVSFIRGVINKYPTYHYRIDLMSYLERNFRTQALFNPMYIMSEHGRYTGVILVQNNNDFLAFGRFKFPNTTLACNFTKEGDYEIMFESDKKCAGLAEVGPILLDSCNVNYIMKISITAGDNKSLLVAILVFLIIASILIISVIVFRFFCCRKGNTRVVNNSKYMKGDVDPGVLEIQSSNSKRI